mmetsp:Transcript_105949/g.306417  ORF Transcript_105949/g.306417 Transcript_105949/m.306417 type:complete len:435 (+) Transcript_105949:342-1646(+)
MKHACIASTSGIDMNNFLERRLETIVSPESSSWSMLKAVAQDKEFSSLMRRTRRRVADGPTRSSSEGMTNICSGPTICNRLLDPKFDLTMSFHQCAWGHLGRGVLKSFKVTLPLPCSSMAPKMRRGCSNNSFHEPLPPNVWCKYSFRCLQPATNFGKSKDPRLSLSKNLVHASSTFPVPLAATQCFRNSKVSRFSSYSCSDLNSKAILEGTWKSHASVHGPAGDSVEYCTLHFWGPDSSPGRAKLSAATHPGPSSNSATTNSSAMYPSAVCLPLASQTAPGFCKLLATYGSFSEDQPMIEMFRGTTSFADKFSKAGSSTKSSSSLPSSATAACSPSDIRYSLMLWYNCCPASCISASCAWLIVCNTCPKFFRRNDMRSGEVGTDEVHSAPVRTVSSASSAPRPAVRLRNRRSKAFSRCFADAVTALFRSTVSSQ